MKTKLLTFLFALVVSAGTINASSVKIDNLYYKLNYSTKEAEVTYKSHDINGPYNIYNNGWNIRDVNIPSKVTYKGVYYNVTSIGGAAFRDCVNLTSITIPNSVTSIGGDAFYGCTGLTSITIPNSVTSIEGKAFYGCTGLTSITIPNSVISIGSSAFEKCTSLTSITIPNSVISVGDYAFEGCSSLPIIDNIRYADTYLVGPVNRSSTSYIIQANTTWIGSRAFINCTNLTSITIPNSVIKIGELVFSGCYRITSMVVDSQNKVYDSRNNCNAIIETSSNTLVAGCAKTIIPNSVSCIGKYSFSYLTTISSITIPNSVKRIEEGAFLKCTSLNSVAIGDNVTYIGDEAFQHCGLTSITIPNKVKSIGKEAFSNCGFWSLIIGSNVVQIGSGAFSNCQNLNNVTNYSPEPQEINDWVFYRSGKSKLYVPQNSLGLYNKAEGWKNFGKILPIPEESQDIDQVQTDKVQSTKLLRDGKLFILRGDKVYTATGQELR